jgi:hypothetical protein
MLIELADPLGVGAGFTARLKLDGLAECRNHYQDLLSSLTSSGS